MKYAGPTVVANPVAGMTIPGSSSSGRSTTLQQKLRRGTIATDVGFTTFESGIRAGWHAEINSKKFRQAVCAEFCATMIFVAFGAASVVFTSDTATMSSVLLSSNLTTATEVPPSSSSLSALQGSGMDTVLTIQYSLPRWLSISFCFGLMIGVLVFSTGSISGGNLNPAVTISLAITQKMSSFRATCYVVAQCFGAVLGAAFIRSLAPDLYVASGGAANQVDWTNRFIGTWTVVGSEMIGTALLVFTVCAAADVGREKNNKYQGALTPFIIGFAVLIGHLFLIPIDGCSINPARTFGTAVVMGNFKDHWVFWMGPILGGMIAALVYDNLFRMYRDRPNNSSNNNNNDKLRNIQDDIGADNKDNSSRDIRVLNQMRLATGINDPDNGAIDLADAYAASSALDTSSKNRSSDWR